MNIKKTYIPSRPRNEKIINQTSVSGIFGGSTGGTGGGGMTSEQLAILNNLASWWKLDEENDAIYSEKSIYSLKGVSALGLGADGGGGGGSDYDRLDAWADYDSSKSGWVLSALLGNDLNNRVSSLEGGSLLGISTSGTGNAITSVSKSGNSLLFTKGLSFALENHTHSNYLQTTLKGAANGLAELDANGFVPSSQLPSYVDDVLEFATLANFPTTGETGKIYVALDTNLTYRWSGSAYVEISKSLALGETSSTAYRGDRGKIAYEHSQAEHQTIINGTGFVKANGKTLSYDNTTYEPAFTKNTAFNKNFGTTAGTVAQGNDSRIINGQTAYGWGDHSLAGYALNSALTAHTGNSTIHITSGERTNWNDANSKKHTHANKSVIDALTQGHIDVLNLLSVVDGNIKVDTTLWATGGISALGLGDGGSSGGGVDMLDSWANYTTEKANFYVPASLLVTFRSDTLSRLTSLESGSATSIATTGAGNAITSVSKSGNTLTFAKGSTFSLSTHNHDAIYKPINYVPSWSEITGKPSTFAPSSHTHTIAQITGLQGALDSKATPSDISTAVENLEIGGRNLIPISKISAHGSSLLVELEQEYQGAPVFKNTVTSPNTLNNFGYRFANLLVLSESTSFTLSLNYNITSYAGTGSDALNGYIRVVYFDDTTGIFNFKNRIVNPNDSNNLNKWHKLEFTFTPTKEIKAFSDFYFYGDCIGAGSEWLLTPPKLEKGNKATGWTPAPEDQVSDWSVTDATSFAFIKNKPTQLSQFIDNIGVASHIANKANPHAVTTAQIGAVDLTTNQTIGGVKTFTGNVTAPTFIGALSGNASSATKLQTARTIWGQNFDGTGNISSDLGIGGATINGTAGRIFFGGNFHIDSADGNSIYLNYYNGTNVFINTGSNQGNTIFGGNVAIGEFDSNYKLNVAGTGRFTSSLIAQSLTLSGAISGATTGSFSDIITQSSNVNESIRLYRTNWTSGTRFELIKSGTVGSEGIGWQWNNGTASNFVFRYINNVGFVTDKITLSGALTGATTISASTSITAPTFIGALSGNATSATKLQTARTIAGVSFDGTANIDIPFANLASKPTTLGGYGITDAVTLNTAQTITGAKTFSTLLTASAGVNAPKVDFGNGFTIEPSGTELVFKYNGVIKQRMLSDGTILATGELTAYVAAT